MDIRLEDANADFISCVFLYLQLRDIIMVFRNLYIEQMRIFSGDNDHDLGGTI